MIVKKRRSSQYIYNNPYANPSNDDIFIECLACKGKGRSKGKFSMRQPFQTINWDAKYGNVNTKGHINAIYNMKAEKVSQLFGNKKLTNMLNFFKVTKSKKEATKLAIEESSEEKTTSQVLCVKKASNNQATLLIKNV